MPLVEKYVTILAKLGLAAGAMGLSAMLGALEPAAASEPPLGSDLSFATRGSVSERLAAVRAAVSTLNDVPGNARPVRSACWGNYPGSPCKGGQPPWHNWGNAHIWPNAHVFQWHH